MLTIGTPEEAGLCRERLKQALKLLERWTKEGKVPGAAIAVARNGVLVEPMGFGRMAPEEDAAPLRSDTIFLVASVTKPVTASAAMRLVEEGRLSLDDRVADIVPEFGNRGKEAITVRHLLTHTSGLPDMVPANRALRAQHAALKTFVQHICDCEVLFPPGTNVSYQSMGIAMLGEIIERITGVPLREYMRRTFFEPMGMEDTSLGMSSDRHHRIALVRIPEDQRGTDWHWNSAYWQGFGAPWGGMFSTVRDMAIFLQMFLEGGRHGGRSILSPMTVRAMITDQIRPMSHIPESVKCAQRWGLGWHLRAGGDLTSSATFGHGGATGTVVWADPKAQFICVIFTTQPGAPLHYCSNAVAGAVL